jgi:hypothetical protein
MIRSMMLVASAATLSIAGAVGAFANPDSYEYRVIHPTYGDIGTYTNVVDHHGDATEVRTSLVIRVRILGIVMYRQEAQRTERWQGQKLISFDSVTVTNGDRLEVHGEQRDGGFLIRNPAGTNLVSAGVHPSNPWSAMVLNADLMMSTRTGKTSPVRVTGGEVQPVSLDGASFRAHQYEIQSYKRHFAWFSDDGVPLAFRTDEDGTMIDFVLTRREQASTAGR